MKIHVEDIILVVMFIIGCVIIALMGGDLR